MSVGDWCVGQQTEGERPTRVAGTNQQPCSLVGIKKGKRKKACPFWRAPGLLERVHPLMLSSVCRSPASPAFQCSLTPGTLQGASAWGWCCLLPDLILWLPSSWAKQLLDPSALWHTEGRCGFFQLWCRRQLLWTLLPLILHGYLINPLCIITHTDSVDSVL